MKAIQYKAFGNSEVIALVEIPTPEIKNDDQLLIQVMAASINPLDMKLRSGSMQQFMPINLPYVPGADVAGVVVATGSKVTQFKVGDRVIAATGKGGYAEYALASESHVATQPADTSFAEATSLVVNLGTAQSLLFTQGKLEKGQRVLIQGAAGATGSAMLQMAKQAGAYVIATASGQGLELVKSLGADEVIDYKTADVSSIKNVDLVADCAGGASQVKLFEVLREGGKLLSIVTPPSKELADKYQVEAQFVQSDISAKSIAPGLALVNDGKLKPIVAKTFPLTEAVQAQDFLSAGSVNGKVVLMVAPE